MVDMAEKNFEELTLNEKIEIVHQGFAHMKNVLDWMHSSDEEANMAQKTQHYFFDKLNQLLESLGFDCSKVRGVNISNYINYSNEYKKICDDFHTKYGFDPICEYGEFPDDYVFEGDYLGQMDPQLSPYSDINSK